MALEEPEGIKKIIPPPLKDKAQKTAPPSKKYSRKSSLKNIWDIRKVIYLLISEHMLKGKDLWETSLRKRGTGSHHFPPPNLQMRYVNTYRKQHNANTLHLAC